MQAAQFEEEAEKVKPTLNHLLCLQKITTRLACVCELHIRFQSFSQEATQPCRLLSFVHLGAGMGHPERLGYHNLCLDVCVCACASEFE